MGESPWYEFQRMRGQESGVNIVAEKPRRNAEIGSVSAQKKHSMRKNTNHHQKVKAI